MPTAIKLPYPAVKMIKLAHPQGGRVVSQINHWLTNSGLEWTCVRLKALRTAALQRAAGNLSVARRIYQENSIAYTRGDLLPKGPFRGVVREYSNAKRPIVMRRCDVILRAYTALRLPALSRSQFNKAVKGIAGAYTGHPDAIDMASQLVKIGADTLGLPTKVQPKRPSISRLKPGTSTHNGGSVPKDVRDLPYGKLAYSLVTSCATSEDLMDDFPQADAFRRLCIDGGADEITPGHIAFLQEKGAKARVVAVPNAWTQWLFQPLHSALDNLIRGCRGSAVHDQNIGAWYIQEYLGKSRLYCFDLSSATDRFPRAVQIQLLNRLGLGRYGDALEQLCQGWQVKAPPFYTGTVDYAVGQPMGLYGSFPLFHLTHLCLLEGMRRVLDYPASSRSYLVLGDDVLIREPALAQLYERVLDALGVDISPTKSISSSQVAEFAGFVGRVTPKGGVTTYRAYKHGDTRIVNNGVQIVYNLGSRVRALSQQWEKYERDFHKTRRYRFPDLSPVVNVDDGGGVNPLTISASRFASILHQVELVTLDQESLDYVVPGLEYSEDWEDIMAELFDEQSPDQVTSLGDLFARCERHGLLEDQPVGKGKPLSSQPPIDLTSDPVIRLFADDPPVRVEGPLHEMGEDSGGAGPGVHQTPGPATDAGKRNPPRGPEPKADNFGKTSLF